jgi:hypothetical protein
MLAAYRPSRLYRHLPPSQHLVRYIVQLFRSIGVQCIREWAHLSEGLSPRHSLYSYVKLLLNSMFCMRVNGSFTVICMHALPMSSC